jgi:hypothetical protein
MDQELVGGSIACISQFLRDQPTGVKHFENQRACGLCQYAASSVSSAMMVI